MRLRVLNQGIANLEKIHPEQALLPFCILLLYVVA
jgi:hypothetical protein